MTEIPLNQNKDTHMGLFNPLSSDFSYIILNDKNEPITYTIPAFDSAYFDSSVYEIMKKHLLDAVKNERNIGLYEEEKEKAILKEITGEL